MTPSDLESWRVTMAGQLGRKPTRTAVCAALGISQNQWAKYERGELPIPRKVALACAALVRGIKPWPE